MAGVERSEPPDVAIPGGSQNLDPSHPPMKRGIKYLHIVLVPEGHFENSPAVYCWVQREKKTLVPKGRLKFLFITNSVSIQVSIVPPGLKRHSGIRFPSDESPGYYRMSLRDKDFSTVFSAGLPTPPMMLSAGLRCLLETSGQPMWHGRETGHNFVLVRPFQGSGGLGNPSTQGDAALTLGY